MSNYNSSPRVAPLLRYAEMGLLESSDEIMLPDALVKRVGWKSGDVLYAVVKNGAILIQKRKKKMR